MPFTYPATTLTRRHGPRGYESYESYKPWLRDEFTYRCFYCLCREVWFPDGDAAFGVDHITPQSAAPERRTEYANLLYACNQCNANRGALPLPLDPAVYPWGEHLSVEASGHLLALTPAGEEVIATCRLNRPTLTEFRQRLLRLVAHLRSQKSREAAALLRGLLRFPTNLPDLSVLKPPTGNERPDGIAACAHERSRRRELPETY
jgi:hypothetical protein